MTTTFLELLPLEIDQISEDELIEPKGAKRDTEHEVGEATIFLRKLYTLWMLVEKDLQQMKMEAKFGSQSVDEAEFLQEAKKLADKLMVLKPLFWYSVMEEFNLWSKPTVAIRRGWLIVWYEERNEFPFKIGGIGFMPNDPLD